MHVGIIFLTSVGTTGVSLLLLFSFLFIILFTTTQIHMLVSEPKFSNKLSTPILPLQDEFERVYSSSSQLMNSHILLQRNLVSMGIDNLLSPRGVEHYAICRLEYILFHIKHRLMVFLNKLALLT